MTSKIIVLDHGFVQLRNISGPTRRPLANYDANDTDPANSARMSFDGMDLERSYEVEMKLNHYLLKNKHMTPFESIEVWLEMKLPIFVARQFVRHRTAALNEVSGRYVTLPEEWYIPEIVGGAAKDKKQGQENNLSEHVQEQFKFYLNSHCKSGYDEYLRAINSGVAPEHARLYLSLNHYTHWLWKQDLRNLLGFLVLRDHGHAQIEAQKYAQAITKLLEPQIPGIMALYRELMK